MNLIAKMGIQYSINDFIAEQEISSYTHCNVMHCIELNRILKVNRFAGLHHVCHNYNSFWVKRLKCRSMSLRQRQDAVDAEARIVESVERG